MTSLSQLPFVEYSPGGVLIKELSSIANIQRIDIQQETELSRMTSGYYGRTVTVSGEFSRRLHVVYLLLRQVNLKTAVYQVFVTATCPLVDSVICFPQRLAKISAGYW